jgi:hypothetical protein
VEEQAGENRAAGAGERGLAGLALQDQQLVPQGKYPDVFAPVTHRQQAQERAGGGGSEAGQALQHNRSSCRPCPAQAKIAGRAAGTA